MKNITKLHTWVIANIRYMHMYAHKRYSACIWGYDACITCVRGNHRHAEWTWLSVYKISRLIRWFCSSVNNIGDSIHNLYFISWKPLVAKETGKGTSTTEKHRSDTKVRESSPGCFHSNNKLNSARVGARLLYNTPVIELGFSSLIKAPLCNIKWYVHRW